MSLDLGQYRAQFKNLMLALIMHVDSFH